MLRMSETNKDLILRSAPKARVSKDGPRAHLLPSFETARYAGLLRMRWRLLFAIRSKHGPSATVDFAALFGGFVLPNITKDYTARAVQRLRRMTDALNDGPLSPAPLIPH